MKNKRATTNDLIVLCRIIDDFKEFEKRLIPMITPKYNIDFVLQLYEVSIGKFKIGAWKAKRFYEENKSVIDTINKCSSISSFIFEMYFKPNEDFQFFYEYISNHKEEMEQILAVLRKLRKLGFWEFEFNESADFTKEIYEVNPIFRNNFGLIYVDNLEVIPSYTNSIKYKTTHSHYRMVLDIIGEEIADCSKKMTLNSLLFNPATLPVNVKRENTFEHIVRLKNEQQKQSAIIRNAVDLSISISDLENQLNTTNNTIGGLDEVKNKDEFVTLLVNIREYVEKLKALSVKHDSNILEQELLVTPEVLNNERDLYLKRRRWSIMDID